VSVITDTNPAAYKDQTAFPIPDGEIMIPRVPDNRAVSNLASRLKPFLGEYAVAVAEVVVDPAQVRTDIAEEQFEYQDTPSGRQLVCIRGRAWTVGVSSDGANGRSRLAQQRDGDVDPWPLPTSSGAEPVLFYAAKSMERMAQASAESSKQIITADMITRVRSNSRGIWNPPLAVVGVAAVTGAEPAVFVHAAEGSTRISTAHHVVGVDYGAPVRAAGNVRGLIRAARAGIASRLVATPESRAAQDAAKLFTFPIRIVIGVLDERGDRCSDPFNEVVSEYVESVHEEPRPWDELAQGNALGERLMLRLNHEGALTDEALADILQRDDFYEGDAHPSEIALEIARAATRPDAEPIVREVILSDPEAKNLTAQRKARALAPLILRAHRDMKGLRESAVAALSRPFLPAALSDPDWTASKRAVDEIQKACEKLVVTESEYWHDDLLELCARAVGPMCALGLVVSDQGQAVDEMKELRGQVSEVVEGLASSVGGVRVMCDAIRRADGDRKLYPAQRYLDGSTVKVEDADGNQIVARYDPQDRNTNILIRALALNEGVVPSTGAGKKGKPSPSPTERFAGLEDDFVQLTGELLKVKTQLMEVLGTDGQPIIDTAKLHGAKFAAVDHRLTEALQFVLQYRGPGVADPDGVFVPDAQDEPEEDDNLGPVK
jgi:hypothetical protein